MAERPADALMRTLRMAYSAHATHAAMTQGAFTLCGVSTRGMVPAAGPVVCRWCRNALAEIEARDDVEVSLTERELHDIADAWARGQNDAPSYMDAVFDYLAAKHDEVDG